MHNETANLGTTQNAPTDYEVLPLATLWPDLRPFCDDPTIQTLLNDATRNWIKNRGWGDDKQLMNTWDIVEALKGRCTAPWQLGEIFTWDIEYDRRIQEAASNQDPLANAATTYSLLHYLAHEMRSIDGTVVSDKEEQFMEDICVRLREHFKPEPGSLDWWVIKGGCHSMAPFALELAKQAFPDGLWEILHGVYHTTLIDEKHHRCFDMFFGDNDYAPGSLHPVEYALMTGPMQWGYFN